MQLNQERKKVMTYIICGKGHVIHQCKELLEKRKSQRKEQKFLSWSKEFMKNGEDICNVKQQYPGILYQGGDH